MMNQEMNNFNVEGNNGIPNNQPLNNFNQDLSNGINQIPQSNINNMGENSINNKPPKNTKIASSKCNGDREKLFAKISTRY